MKELGGPDDGEPSDPVERIFSADIDIEKIPADERAAFHDAVRTCEEQMRKAYASAVELATEASLRPTCRFDFDMKRAKLILDDSSRRSELEANYAYRLINSLLDYFVLLENADESKETFVNALTALRMTAHIRSGQPTAVFIDQLAREQESLNGIGRWAFRRNRTDAELREAATQLDEYYGMAPLSPNENLLADHLLIQHVLAGDVYPLALAKDPNSKPVYWAYLANRLEWECERGQRALDLVTLQNISNVDKLVQNLATRELPEFGNWLIRRWMRPTWFGNEWPDVWSLQQPAAATSYLTRFEYEARVGMNEINRAVCDAEVFRRATILKIALARYRLTHDEYPETLAQLVPEYVERELLDPYSFRPFQYAPRGLDLALKTLIVGETRQRYEANTPLFWSVGVGNSRLEKQNETQRIENAADPTGDLLETTETIYAITGNEQPWWNEPVFVFTLPE